MHLDYYFPFLQPVYSAILCLGFGIGIPDYEWHVRQGLDYWISYKDVRLFTFSKFLITFLFVLAFKYVLL